MGWEKMEKLELGSVGKLFGFFSVLKIRACSTESGDGAKSVELRRKCAELQN